MFKIRLLGTASIESAHAPLNGRAAQGRQLALLAVLALARGRPVSRDKLISVLWPEARPERGRPLLSQTLYTVRDSLGDEVVQAAGDLLVLNRDVVTSDVAQFESALADGRLEEAVALYAGPFLDGFHVRGSAEFEAWLDGERAELERRYADALEKLATAAEAPAAALEWWRRLAAHDPYNGRVALRLMQALEAAGDRAGALQHAHIHAALLRGQLDVEPDADVAAYSEQLRLERRPAPAGPKPAPGPTVGNSGADPSRPTAAPPELGAHSAAELASPLPGGGAAPALPDRPAEPNDATAAPAGAGGGRRRQPWIVRHLAAAAGLVGLVVTTVLVMASWRRQLAPDAIDDRRVVVGLFENRTGDPSFDALGAMARDWIAQSLSRVTNMDVVTSTSGLEPGLNGSTAAAESAAVDSIRAITDETGARLVVSGGYYMHGDSLQFHAHITDARERRILRSLEPITGAPSDSRRTVEELGRRAAAAVAVVLDTRFAALGNLASAPSNYEAYHACLEGLAPFFAADWPAALRHFERSIRLDSAYLFPLLHIGYVRLNLGDLAAADSIVRVLNGSRERMMPFELAILDLLSGYLAEDPVASYEAARRAAAIGPGSPPHVQWGAEALRLNRPREAIRILTAIQPEAAPIGGWPLYWRSLTSAHHSLGGHARELRVARAARRSYPHEVWPLLNEGRALAALGRVAELETLLSSRQALPHHRRPDPGALMTVIGEELRVHGHQRASSDWLERAVEWYRTQAAEQQAQPEHQRELAIVLLAMGRLDEARAILNELAERDPHNVDLAGALGVIAARSGDDAGAATISSSLAVPWGSYGRGRQLLWRACIAAHRGQLEAAVSLLQAAAGRAAHFEHTHTCLDPLRDYAPFHDFTRPKG